MERFIRVLGICLFFWFASAQMNLFADVYIWTDENGVKHFSNVAPSEAAGEEVQKDKEVPDELGSENPANTTVPAAPAEAEAAESEAVESEAAESETSPEPAEQEPEAEPSEDSADSETSPEPAEQEPEAEPSEDSADDSQASTQPEVELEQGNPVDTEKNRVQALAQALSEGSGSREVMLENEKKRLEQIIENLKKKPLAQFGSQKNKSRQIGFYQYRLQELVSAPDSYLKYGGESQ